MDWSEDCAPATTGDASTVAAAADSSAVVAPPRHIVSVRASSEGTVLEQLHRLAAKQQTFRLLRAALGPPGVADATTGEKEDYFQLADDVADAFDAIAARGLPPHTARRRFARVINHEDADDKADANDDDDSDSSNDAERPIPREHCDPLYAALHANRGAKLAAAVAAGAQLAAQRLIDDENGKNAAAVAGGDAAATAAAPVTRLAPEDKFSLLLLAQQGEGAAHVVPHGVDTDADAAPQAEVELNDCEPKFLRGLLGRRPFVPRFVNASSVQVTPAPGARGGRGGGLGGGGGGGRGGGPFVQDPQAAASTAMVHIAARAEALMSDRYKLKKRERRRQEDAGPLRIGFGGAAEKGAAGGGGGGGGPTIGFLREELGESQDETGCALPPWLRAGGGGGDGSGGDGASGPSFGPRKNQQLQEQRRSLPIYQYKEEFLARVAASQVLVLQAETGSGKTTQLTQYLVDGGYASGGRIIGCTQPRRVAATSVAERVAEEFGCALGEEVGYSVRFKDMTSRMTKIKYMTDGLLLREALLDDRFERYSVIILDEAHERGLNTDVLFGLMKAALERRPDLKMIVTSATLEIERFCGFFRAPNPLSIPGRTYPVDVRHETEPVEDYFFAALRKTMDVHLHEPIGDVLVFLPGQQEIEMAAQELEAWTEKLGDIGITLVVRMLFAKLPREQQALAFERVPELSRKVVLCTNLAETSITIDGLYYVIDCGYCKMNMFDPTTGVEHLKVVPVSQSQARQRAGRAGRTGPGRCYRLYTEAQFLELPMASPPEIQRTNLGNVVLTLKAIGINDLFNFQFMDAPPRETLAKAMENLFYLGALDVDGLLTTLGRRMSALPIEPSESKTLLTAVDLGCVDKVLSIIAMLSSPGVFHRPRDKQEEADRRHGLFHHHEGDQLTMAAVYEAWVQAGMSDQWCRANFLNVRGIKDAHEVRLQLERILSRKGAEGAPRAAAPSAASLGGFGEDTTAARKAITAGYFFQAAKASNDGRYLTMRDRREVTIHPSSALYHVRPRCLIFHELAMTTKEYMRDVMAIEPQWLVELAPQYYTTPREGMLTKEQQAARFTPMLRAWEKGNDWRISKLRRRGR